MTTLTRERERLDMAKMTFVCYPKCSTCKKAQKWLDGRGVEYAYRDIVQDNPSATELEQWHSWSGLPIRRLFNTSGMKYRELNLKAQLDAGMTDDECYQVLSGDGMLVKRPILVIEDGHTKKALFGFRQDEWESALGDQS